MNPREFTLEDLPAALEIHKNAELDPRCFPDLMIEDKDGKQIQNPLFITKAVYEQKGKPALMSFLKVTSELYLLVDHEVGTPEERWEWLKEFKEYMQREAWKHGLDQMTAFIPTDMEKSFGPRLIDMGFVRSPWQSYTLNLE